MNPSEIQKLAKADSVLEDFYIASTKKYSRVISKASQVLILGGTGVIAPGLIFEYLRIGCKVVVLMRGEGDSTKERLLNYLKEFPEYAVLREECETIQTISGDLAKDNFELNQQDKEIFLRSNLIWHCAAWTNHVRPYVILENTLKPDIRQTNAISVKRALKLIMDSGFNIPYNFISTAPAAPIKDGILAEAVMHLDIKNNNGYVMSKKVAEALLKQANKRGFDVGIYRLGYVVGNSKNGMFPSSIRIDHLMAEIFAVIDSGCYPLWDGIKKNVMPYDIVGSLLFKINNNFDHKNIVYNVVNPQSATWIEIINGLQKMLPNQLKMVSNETFIQNVLNSNLNLAKFINNSNYPNDREPSESVKLFATICNIATFNMLNASNMKAKDIPDSLQVILLCVKYLMHKI